MPTQVLSNQSPYQTIFKEKPNYTKLKIFGCLCFPWLRPYTPHKLAPRSIPCIFLGYSLTQSAYLCLDQATNRVYVSRHVKFDETSFPYTPPAPSTSPTTPENQTSTHSPPTQIPVTTPLNMAHSAPLGGTATPDSGSSPEASPESAQSPVASLPSSHDQTSSHDDNTEALSAEGDDSTSSGSASLGQDSNVAQSTVPQPTVQPQAQPTPTPSPTTSQPSHSSSPSSPPPPTVTAPPQNQHPMRTRAKNHL